MAQRSATKALIALSVIEKPVGAIARRLRFDAPASASWFPLKAVVCFQMNGVGVVGGGAGLLPFQLGCSLVNLMGNTLTAHPVRHRVTNGADDTLTRRLSPGPVR